MMYRSLSSRSGKKAGLAALLVILAAATVLLVSCPPPEPPPIPPPPPPRSSLPRGNFNTLVAVDRNTNTHGIWANNETIWVLYGNPSKIFAYNIETRERDRAKDFNTLGDRSFPQSIWSDGITMWVGDGSNMLFAYDMESKARDMPKDITLDPTNNSPVGMWGNTETLWVANDFTTTLFAYNMSDKVRNTANEFTLTPQVPNPDPMIGGNLPGTGNGSPKGIWSDGTTMWVSDLSDDKIYAYNLSSRMYDEAKDFNSLAAGNTELFGIGGNAEAGTMWVVDNADNKIYAYNISDKAYNAANDFNALSVGNDEPYDIWSDGTTMWVVNQSDHNIYAYNMRTKEYSAIKSFNSLLATVTAANDAVGMPMNSTGIWSNGATVWVADNRVDRIYAFNLKSRAYEEDNDIPLASGNADPGGIYSDGETMWVVNNFIDPPDDPNAPPVPPTVDKVYAYNMTSKEQDTDKTFSLHADNTDPVGIWVNNGTLWVSDNVDGRIYSYINKARNVAQEFITATLRSLGNTAPGGIWSNGETMWVLDTYDNKINAYNLLTQRPDP